jgi:hypothetical protein
VGSVNFVQELQELLMSTMALADNFPGDDTHNPTAAFPLFTYEGAGRATSSQPPPLITLESFATSSVTVSGFVVRPVRTPRYAPLRVFS